MSFLNPKPDNPVTKYIEWKSDDKHFSYWDKETEKNVSIELPIKFIVFDEFSTIKGYNEFSKSGIYSNEVSDLSKEILNVRAFKGNFLITGLYKDIKDRALAEGGRFCKSVYGVLFDKENYEIVNFQFKGASGGSWIEKKFNTDNFSVKVEKFGEDKKGKTEYTFPVFEKGFEITKEIREKLIPIATLLSNYLQSKKQKQDESEIPIEHTEDVIDENFPKKDEDINDVIPAEVVNEDSEILPF